MNRILQVLSVCALLTGMLTMNACIEEDFRQNDNIVEGQPVKVKMKFQPAISSDVVVTRAGDHSLSEFSNLILFIYRHGGGFEGVVSTTDGTLQMTKGSAENIYYATFGATSGRKDLLAVANNSVSADDGGFWESMTSIINAAPTITFDELKSTIINLRSDVQGQEIRPIQIVSASQMLITGWNESVVFSTKGTIDDYGTYGDEENQICVKMERTMAKITFNIEADPVGASGTFTPSNYQVFNIPRGTYLTNMNSVSKKQTDSRVGFMNYLQTNIGGVTSGKYSFNFFMPENVYDAVSKEGGSALDYTDREKWNYVGAEGSAPGNKIWTFAPQNSTFVVIYGYYTGTSIDPTTQETVSYSGNVEYTIHLGDFGSSNGNFAVERNCNYIFNVKVLGVDNIVVEAKKEDDRQPGAEGHIFDYSHTVYNYLLDSHYEQVYLEYNLSEIAQSLPAGLAGEDLDNAIADNLLLVIQSEAMDYSKVDPDFSVHNKRGSLKPYKIYCDAIRENVDPEVKKKQIMNGDGRGRSGFDYKWVEFWPQAETTIASYPGVSEWSREVVSDLINGNEAYGSETVTENSKFLIDVYDMVVAMGKVVSKIYQGQPVSTAERAEDRITVTNVGGDYIARFTAFVNEYFYYKHPLTHENVTTWNVMTNKIPREMVIAMSTQISNDGNSSLSQIYSYISQLSMQTFYSTRSIQLDGFGLETYNETPLLDRFRPRGVASYDNDLTDSDGRYNQLRMLGANTMQDGFLYYNLRESWSAYVNSENNGWTTSTSPVHREHKLNNAYPEQTRGAYSACMSRNRDLNGDGIIQDNEIRWYLPSLNEYIRTGIGAQAISNAARLYMGDKQDMVKSGYPSSYLADGALYYTSSAGENAMKRVYWAVEKGPYGPENGYYTGSLPIRCVRVLPAIIKENNKDISTIRGVIATSTVEKVTKTDLPDILKFKDRLVESLYRERVASGSLTAHNEDEPQNLFYEGIFVAERTINPDIPLGRIIGYRGTVDGRYYDGTMVNPCASYSENGITGWRVPNLVEFSALNALGYLKSNETSCTQFSNQKVRYGFAFNGIVFCPGGNDTDINSTYSIRCVKDVPENFSF